MRKDAAEVALLLAEGADYEAKDADGISPTQLMYRESRERFGAFFELIRGFSRIEKVFRDWMMDPRCFGSLTWLHAGDLLRAIEDDDLAEARRLLDEGGVWDLDLRLEDGTTPLHYAARHGNPRMVKLLLDHDMAIESDGRTKQFGRADPAARDRAGNTALDHAIERGHAKVVSLLQAHGSRRQTNTPASPAPPSESLATIEWAVLDRTVRAIRDHVELIGGGSPVQSVVFSGDVLSCVVALLNVPALRDRDLDRVTALELAQGTRVEGGYLTTGDAEQIRALANVEDTREAVWIVMYRVCARLETERARWKPLRLARRLRFAYVDHVKDEPDVALRRLAMRSRELPIEAYVRRAVRRLHRP